MENVETEYKKYIAPFDMCGGKIKKGDILKKLKNGKKILQCSDRYCHISYTGNVLSKSKEKRS